MKMTWRFWVPPMLSALGLAWSGLAGVSIWITPMRYSGTSAGVPAVWERSFSDVSPLGAFPLLIPVLFAGLRTWVACRGRRVTLGVAALVLAVFTFITGFSIGAAYIPAAGLLIVAAGCAAVAGAGPPTGRLTSRCRRRAARGSRKSETSASVYSLPSSPMMRDAGLGERKLRDKPLLPPGCNPPLESLAAFAVRNLSPTSCWRFENGG